MKKLSDFSNNIYSQFGEDGIIAKIYEIIGYENKTCIEFGAWDGFHLSNTANLWTKGWQGILIEADKEKYTQLVDNTKEYECICIHAFVGIRGKDSLEAMLSENKINFNAIDLISIDIDSNDYYVFNSINQLRPRVIICEYNPTIPPELDVYPEEGSNIGCSAFALVRIAETKGYRLVAVTDTNCFFVKKELIYLFRDFLIDLKELKIDKYLTYVATSYAGDYVIMSASQLPYGIAQRYEGALLGNFVNLTDAFFKKLLGTRG